MADDVMTGEEIDAHEKRLMKTHRERAAKILAAVERAPITKAFEDVLEQAEETRDSVTKSLATNFIQAGQKLKDQLRSRVAAYDMQLNPPPPPEPVPTPPAPPADPSAPPA